MIPNNNSKMRKELRSLLIGMFSCSAIGVQAQVVLAYPGETIVFASKLPNSVSIEPPSDFPSIPVLSHDTWSHENNDGLQVVPLAGKVRVVLPYACKSNDGLLNVTYYNPNSGSQSVISFRLVESGKTLDNYEYEYFDQMPVAGKQLDLKFISRSRHGAEFLTVVKGTGKSTTKQRPKHPHTSGQFPDLVQIGPWDKRWDPNKPSPQYVTPRYGDTVVLGDLNETDGDPWITYGQPKLVSSGSGSGSVYNEGSVALEGGYKVGVSWGAGTSAAVHMLIYQCLEYCLKNLRLDKPQVGSSPHGQAHENFLQSLLNDCSSHWRK